MKANPLISIIMAVRNEEKYIADAIESVFNQTYLNWELVIVDNGSTDLTISIVSSFKDSRVRVFSESPKGVSIARNLGLQNMKGDYYCFLDGDDILTQTSIEERLNLFHKDNSIDFVDGKVEVFNESLTKKIKTFVPDFSGNPRRDLIMLAGKSFFGPTWMVKVAKSQNFRFNTQLTHGEDLYFYFCQSKYGKYSFVESPILISRKRAYSAMSNLNGLGKGYYIISRLLYSHHPEIDYWLKLHFDIKRRKIMFLSYLSQRLFTSGIRYMLTGR